MFSGLEWHYYKVTKLFPWLFSGLHLSWGDEHEPQRSHSIQGWSFRAGSPRSASHHQVKIKSILIVYKTKKVSFNSTVIKINTSTINEKVEKRKSWKANFIGKLVWWSEVKAKGGSKSVFMIEVIEINKTSIFPIFIAIRLISKYVRSCAHVFTFCIVQICFVKVYQMKHSVIR